MRLALRRPCCVITSLYPPEIFFSQKITFYFRWHLTCEKKKIYKVENVICSLNFLCLTHTGRISAQRHSDPQKDLMKSKRIEKWNVKVNQNRVRSDGEHTKFAVDFPDCTLNFSSRGVFFQLLLICNVSQQPRNPPDRFSTCQQQMSWQSGWPDVSKHCFHKDFKMPSYAQMDQT